MIGQSLSASLTTVVVASDGAAPYKVWRRLCTVDPASWRGKTVILNTGIEREPTFEEAWECVLAQVELLNKYGAKVVLLGVSGTPRDDVVNANLKSLAYHSGAGFKERCDEATRDEAGGSARRDAPANGRP